MRVISLCLCLDANEVGCSMTSVVKEQPIALSSGEVDWSIHTVLELCSSDEGTHLTGLVFTG